MTGPEHYREAERLLAQEYETWEERSAINGAAQVHATLALATATALGRLRVDDNEWLQATSRTEFENRKDQ